MYIKNSTSFDKNKREEQAIGSVEFCTFKGSVVQFRQSPGVDHREMILGWRFLLILV
jgi:hypothetical protein